MSVTLMAEVMNKCPGLTPNEKLVCLIYADHANDEGRNTYPSAATVASKTGLTRRSVIRIVARLKRRRILYPEGVTDIRTVRYKLDLTPAHSDTESPSDSDTESPYSDTESPSDSDTESPDLMHLTMHACTYAGITAKHAPELAETAIYNYGIDAPATIRALDREIRRRVNINNPPAILARQIREGKLPAGKTNRRYYDL